MKPAFDDILNSLPKKPPRSRLEPYRDLIEELRRRKRTFHQIAEVLAENLGVKVTGSGVHDFLRRRARHTLDRTPLSTKAAKPRIDTPRLEPLKEQKPRQEELEAFDFDPGEPLRLTSRQKIRGE